VGGFNGGTARKIALLKSEGVKIKNGRISFPLFKGGLRGI
jgi:hypothetical protein